MENNFWHEWYNGWGWVLWFGFWFLMISSLGNWGYTYNGQRKYGINSKRSAMDILNERYASGEVTRAEFRQLKSDIKGEDLIPNFSSSAHSPGPA